MRIRNETRFPHPVLAEHTDDYRSDEFRLALEAEEIAEEGKVSFTGQLDLRSDGLTRLVESGRAQVGIMVVCQGTYYDNFHLCSLGLLGWSMDGGLLRGTVKVRAVIICIADNTVLDSDDIEDEYEPQSLVVNMGDPVALSEEFTFEAGLEKDTPLESVFRLVSDDNIGPGMFGVDYSGESIEIHAGKSLFEYIDLQRAQASRDILLSALYLPVVMDVLEVMRNGDGFEDRHWHVVIASRCRAEGISLEGNSDLAEAAQRLLGSPLGELKKTMERLGT